jgi:hypothetical protein
MKFVTSYILILLLCFLIILPFLFISVLYNFFAQNEKLDRVNDLMFGIMIRMLKFEIITTFDLKEIYDLIKEIEEDK